MSFPAEALGGTALALFTETNRQSGIRQQPQHGPGQDLAELNPFLDERGRTAKLMVDLVGSLMGRKVFDRPTQSAG